jgi:hypothetical protein
MEPNEPNGQPSRRRAIQTGAGLVAGPLILAAGGCAQEKAEPMAPL